MPNPPAKEDTWAFQKIGSAFPPNPCLGQQNMYVALWYKHGKPIHGRSWNNGGVVECSFPFKKAELRTAQQLEGNIQVLQYVGDHNTQGFWYEWILYKDRFDKSQGREIVRCGDSIPILWKDRPEGALLGYVDNKTEIALFSCDGKVYEKQGGDLKNMYIITRNLIGGPPYCECPNCKVAPPPPGPPPPRVMIDEWMDLRAGDAWPDRPLVKALDKTLDTIAGENPDQFVALWYQAGEPVMGRVWNEGGKVTSTQITKTDDANKRFQVAANFCWNKNEYKGNVGSIQVLVHLSEHVRGFDYKWLPYPEAASFDKDKEWLPVHVNNAKGDISAGVITINGKQILGKVDVRNEKSAAGFGGKENMLVGPECAKNTIVLCRKARPGYKFD
ncbi:unnamed protein product [Haemonchus placei]|uniref:B30.2/SPRY domain-containing protein n=1 Tax=Haemonchus placei TaxID=6290 RepID=A0A0N4WKD1_HAEPC|nr:unnamed protein product [Haemonchus placei]